jgi:hypothetical protein
MLGYCEGGQHLGRLERCDLPRCRGDGSVGGDEELSGVPGPQDPRRPPDGRGTIKKLPKFAQFLAKPASIPYKNGPF